MEYHEAVKENGLYCQDCADDKWTMVSERNEVEDELPAQCIDCDALIK